MTDQPQCESPIEAAILTPLDLPVENLPEIVAETPAEPVVVKRAKLRLARGLCAECKTSLREKGKPQGAKFCSPACHDAFHNREKVQGRQLINLAKQWRRYGKKGDFTAMTRMLDKLISDDKAIGLDQYPKGPIEAYYTVRTNINPKVRRG